VEQPAGLNVPGILDHKSFPAIHGIERVDTVGWDYHKLHELVPWGRGAVFSDRAVSFPIVEWHKELTADRKVAGGGIDS
jgi:hypothetical protein